MTRQIKMSWVRFDNAVRQLAIRIKKSGIKVSNVYGNPRGGLIVAVRLSHLLDVPLITETWKANIDTLIVDDIVDTGNTLIDFHENFKIAVLYLNPKASFIPEFHILLKPYDSWIWFPWEKR